MNWYDNYLNIPHKHLGNSKHTGIDCVNLCSLIYKEQLGIDVGISSHEYCNIIDDDWYNKTTNQVLTNTLNNSNNWTKVVTPKPFDIILLSIGDTNITNHCSMYVGNNKILHTALHNRSHLCVYGSYYKQYTTGIYRWNSLNN
jgi:cell wall-associated NlpC family hydrolase